MPSKAGSFSVNVMHLGQKKKEKQSVELCPYLHVFLFRSVLIKPVFHAHFQPIIWAHTHYSSSRLELSRWLSTGVNPTVKAAVGVSINLHNGTAPLIFTAPL